MMKQLKITNGWVLYVTGGSEVYLTYGPEFKFVARFKHGSPKASANHFARFLMKNFTPAEYFAEYAAGKTPADILEQRGYVPYNVLKIIKQHGRAAVAGTRWA